MASALPSCLTHSLSLTPSQPEPEILLLQTLEPDSTKKAAAADRHGWTARRASCLAATVGGDGRGLGAALLGARNGFGLGSEALPGHTGGGVEAGTTDPRVLQGEGAGIA
jgi:hypothetical protein